MYRSVIAVILLMIATLPAQTNAQGLQTRANEIRAAMDARDFERAERLARDLRERDQDLFTRNNYDYLLARLAERRGARAEASSLYLGLLGRNSNLSQYALWHLAGIARAAGDLALERQYLTRLLTVFPSSALVGRARDRMIDSHFESGDYRASIALLRPVASTSGVRGRNAMARLGEAYSKAGDAQSARALFNQLIGASRDDYALAASAELDSLDRAAGAKPTEFEALRRARIYLTNRHWSEARAHFLDVVERFPDSPNRAEALYQTGFTFYRDDRQEDAIKWFERVRQEFPAKKEGEQGYYWVGTALQKARRYEEAARRYSDFIAAYPNSELVEGAYRNVVDSLRYAGKDAEAIDWSRRIQQRFANQPLAAVGLFNEARIELTRGNYDAALQLLTRVQAQPLTPRLVSAPIRGEAAFMRIYAIEQMGRLGEAARLYLAIPAERDNYFGNRATLRLKAMAATEDGRRVIEPLARGYREQARAALQAGRYGEAKDAATQALRLTEDANARRDLLALLRASYSQLTAYNVGSRFRLINAARALITSSQQASTDTSHSTLAAELLFLGVYDEGAAELRLGGLTGARASNDSGDEVDENSPRASQAATPAAGGDAAYSLAVYSNRGDEGWYAIKFGESVARTIPQDYRLELLPRDLAELIYPAPYRDLLNRYGSKNQIDPRLVLSLARQESRFNPSVKSPAAARGLLQFINETALKLAEEEGIKNFELDDVYEPEVAIRLASRNVANLLKQFPDNSYAVAASYNTYDTNVERWMYRSRSNDIDRFTVEIALPETKDYVAKVMNNYWAYQQLYSRDLSPHRE
ncbi:MAG TPA: tetratricopeptide repeat protein [Blastocatellia bacterium]|jgi:soluble lytic murein transglycosylase|nr:tetratricopeptide repeat protein [Blastocatellia bacterium]